MAIQYTQASAGSGKTYSIQRKVAKMLIDGTIKPAELIVVTFTVKAADELKTRITTELIQCRQYDLAVNLADAHIGTIHSVCGAFLKDYAFEMGLSPNQRVLDDSDKNQLIKEALDACLDTAETKTLNALARRLSIESWQQDVLKLIESARLNDISREALDEFAISSQQSMASLLGKADINITEAGLMDHLQTVYENTRTLTKPTKGLLNSIATIESILRNNTLTWQDWIKLSKLKAGVKEKPILQALIEYSSSVLVCSDFQQDIYDMITHVFSAACKVMSGFATVKAERGLVDFVDQEHLFLTALNQPSISALLNRQIKFLIVDEFQDTNPLQLAVFSKLASLSDHILFVGDVKQAIYGFRGSDAQLSLDVIRYIEKAGTVDTLEKSWRSRPGLVYFNNALFTEPFNHLLEANQVSLTPAKDYILPIPEVSAWTLMGTNQSLRCKALSMGIRSLVESNFTVWDKQKNTQRYAQWRDIAILCYSNPEAQTVANALISMGVPASTSRMGLLGTPEGALAMASIRRLADPSDSLASAEILTLCTGDNPEHWLDNRLDALQNDQNYEWADTACDQLKKLANARAKLGALSPKEALITALCAADVHQTIVSWREDRRLTDHRLANLQHLIGLADVYQDHCHASHSAGSIGGFILWLQQQEQALGDAQATDAGNAVNVMTYHGAKGLEWPVVICSSLDREIKVRPFGVQVLPSNNDFQWENPLQYRAIQYWPCPFPDQRQNDPLTQAFIASPAWATSEQREHDEALRLLYVGITRACDHLILTDRASGTVGRWLSILKSPTLPLNNGELLLPCGNTVSVSRQEIAPPDETPIFSPRKRYWLMPASPKQDEKPAYFHPPSSELPLTNANAHVVHDFGWRITLNGHPRMDDLGETVHQGLSVCLNHPQIDASLIDDMIRQRNPGAISTADIQRRALELTEWIEKNYPNSTLNTEFPFRYHLENGQLCSGQIDLVVETEAGWVIIDHKSNPQAKSEWPEIALKYSGQLKAYADALLQLNGKKILAKYVHFAVSGGMVQLSK